MQEKFVYSRKLVHVNLENLPFISDSSLTPNRIIKRPFVPKNVNWSHSFKYTNFPLQTYDETLFCKFRYRIKVQLQFS